MKVFIYTWYFLRSTALRGFVNTIRFLKAEAVYEKQFGIKTSSIKKSDSKEFHHYQGAGYLPLLRILQDVIKKTSNFDFVDIGCGKGRAIFMAEYCGYNQLTGIELDEDLIKAAQTNLSTYTFKRNESEIQFIFTNALDYTYKNKPTVYFLFNPFNENVMKSVLNKIAKSSTCETWFIYMNPLYTTPFLEKNIEVIKEFKTGSYTEAIVFRSNTTESKNL